VRSLLDLSWPREKGARVQRSVTAPDSAAWIKSMHDRGLGVYAWTFRDDKPGRGFSDSETEIRGAIANGVDGFFTDFPATGVAAREKK